MKSFRWILSGMVIVSGVFFSSCGDDEDVVTDEPGGGQTAAPSTENVFSSGVPTKVGGSTLTVNDKGQVTSIASAYDDITFEYGTFSRAESAEFQVLMKSREKDYPGEGFDMYMKLNDKGFVEYALEVYLDESEETDQWWFGYNADGQLNKLKRSEGDDNYVITYDGGNAVKVVNDSEGDHSEVVIGYTNSQFKTPVANKGCVMLFDEALCVDMDEMGVVYFAGLLGRATKDLPMQISGKDNSGYTFSEVYDWTFDSNQLPLTFRSEGDHTDVFNFTW